MVGNSREAQPFLMIFEWGCGSPPWLKDGPEYCAAHPGRRNELPNPQYPSLGMARQSGSLRQCWAGSGRDLSMSDAGLVHIVDDDPGVRAGLSSLVRSVGYAARLYTSAGEFLASELPAIPSCLLLDVRLPGTNGLDLQDSLRQRGIEFPVILMTGYGDVQMSVRGMKAGAVDFLTKPLRHQDVLDAIALAVARDQERRAATQKIDAIRARIRVLTPRERQVMDLVATGKMNKQIASDLGLSQITVKMHRGSLMKKMGVRSVAELVKLVEAHRLAEGGEQHRRASAVNS
jgi:FixJ family two-component response regulator